MVGAYVSTRDKTNAYKILIEIRGRYYLGYVGIDRRIKLQFILENTFEEMKWIYVVHGRVLWRALVETGMNPRLFRPTEGLLITH
jgi:hypothetical protein